MINFFTELHSRCAVKHVRQTPGETTAQMLDGSPSRRRRHRSSPARDGGDHHRTHRDDQHRTHRGDTHRERKSHTHRSSSRRPLPDAEPTSRRRRARSRERGAATDSDRSRGAPALATALGAAKTAVSLARSAPLARAPPPLSAGEAEGARRMTAHELQFLTLRSELAVLEEHVGAAERYAVAVDDELQQWKAARKRDGTSRTGKKPRDRCKRSARERPRRPPPKSQRNRGSRSPPPRSFKQPTTPVQQSMVVGVVALATASNAVPAPFVRPIQF